MTIVMSASISPRTCCAAWCERSRNVESATPKVARAKLHALVGLAAACMIGDGGVHRAHHWARLFGPAATRSS